MLGGHGMSGTGWGPSSALRFAAAQARALGRTERRLLLQFAATSAGRAAATVAVILLIRDFHTGVLSAPSGLAAELTTTVGQAAALWIVVGLLLAAYLVSGLCLYASHVTMQQLIRRLELDLIRQVMTHILRLPVAFFDRRHRGDILESVRQDVAKTRAATGAVIEMALFGTQAVAYAVSALVISPRLVLASVPVLLLAAMPTRSMARQVRRRSMRLRGHAYRLTDLLLQLLHGIRIVKVYAGEALEIRNSITTAERYFQEVIATARVRALTEMVVETLAGISVVVVIVIGGFEVMAGRLSAAALVAVLIALRAVHGPLSNCLMKFMEVQRNSASAERVRELLATEPDVTDRPDARALEGPIETIAFEQVSFGYDAHSTVLTDVSFEARTGQHIGIVGPSGAGKTTVVSLLARFYDPSAGRIVINGIDLRDYRRADLYQQMALVTQDPFVFGTSVRENIRYGHLTATDADIERAATAAEIHEDILALPEGYETVIGVGGRLLSAGQVQRINVARAMLKDASLVMLDEATSNLDAISERKIQVALRRLAHGRTTVTVAHRLSVVRHADLILVMDRGVCVARGSHDALLRDSALYRELWSTQRTDDRAAGGHLTPHDDYVLGHPGR
jgi:ABC-type multidrug transport system fused ATPase/permease subunit